MKLRFFARLRDCLYTHSRTVSSVMLVSFTVTGVLHYTMPYCCIETTDNGALLASLSIQRVRNNVQEDMKAAASYRFRVLFCRMSRSHMRWPAGHAQWRCFRMLFAPWNYIVPRPSPRLPYIHLNNIRTSLGGFMAMCIRTWSILNSSV